MYIAISSHTWYYLNSYFLLMLVYPASLIHYHRRRTCITQVFLFPEYYLRSASPSCVFLTFFFTSVSQCHCITILDLILSISYIVFVWADETIDHLFNAARTLTELLTEVQMSLRGWLYALKISWELVERKKKKKWKEENTFLLLFFSIGFKDNRLDHS